VLGLAYTWLDTEILANRGRATAELPLGAPLFRKPRHSGALSLQHTWGRLQTHLLTTLVGDSEDIDTRTLPARRVPLPGYVRLDPAVSFLILREARWFNELSVFGRARNLLDRRYEEGFGVSAPHVSFLGGIKARF